MKADVHFTGVGGGGTSDRLAVSGNTSGRTSVALDVTGSPTAATGRGPTDGIQLIQIDGASNGAFVLAEPVVAGGYEFSLSLADGQNWFLQSSAASQMGAYTMLPYMIADIVDEVGTLYERVGARQFGEAAEQERGRGFWGRVEGSRISVNPDDGYDFRKDRALIQLGLDLPGGKVGDGDIVWGVTGHYASIDGDSDDGELLRGSDVSVDGFGLGATATWYSPKGFYADAVGHVTWYDDAEVKVDGRGKVADVGGGFGWTLSLEAGKRIPLNEETTLIPQGQLWYTDGSLDSFTDRDGLRVDIEDSEFLFGRLGVAIEHRRRDETAGGKDRLTLYAEANIVQQFLDTPSVNVGTNSFSTKVPDTWAEIGIGATYQINKDVSAYGELDASTSLSDGAGDSWGASVVLGLRAAF